MPERTANNSTVMLNVPEERVTPSGGEISGSEKLNVHSGWLTAGKPYKAGQR